MWWGCPCFVAPVPFPWVGHRHPRGQKPDQPDADHQPSQEDHSSGGPEAPMGLCKCPPPRWRHAASSCSVHLLCVLQPCFFLVSPSCSNGPQWRPWCTDRRLWSVWRNSTPEGNSRFVYRLTLVLTCCATHLALKTCNHAILEAIHSAYTIIEKLSVWSLYWFLCLLGGNSDNYVGFPKLLW